MYSLSSCSQTHEEVVMRASSFLAAIAVLCGVASAAQAENTCNRPHASGVQQRQITSGGRERSYRLFVPPAYDGRTPLSLVLELHGSGGTSAGQARTSGFEDVAAREGFLVASLQADGGRWNVPVRENRPDDVAYAGDVIDDVAAQVCTDTKRVYATGFSGGARMSSLLGCRLNTRIAAIAPVSGLRWPAPCNGRPVPVLTFHGLADPQNTYDGKADGRGDEWLESVPDALAGWAGYNGCNLKVALEDPPGPLSTMRYTRCRKGVEVRMIRIDGLGHTWTRKEIDTTEVMWQFFKKHHLP
jgi:polyhydroxybutyrate depolymerase